MRQSKIRTRQINKEVFTAADPIIKVEAQDIKWLKESAADNRRKRCRLCAHGDINDALHEMLIVLDKETYIRPHKHAGKSESFHIIEGAADIVVFDNEGNIIEVVRMGDYRSGRTFYYRISDPYYHTPLIRSDCLVFHETTNGPFKRDDTVFAEWAPEDSDNVAGKKYMGQLAQDVDNFCRDA